MLVRQFECAVDALDNRMHEEDARAKRASTATTRNDSKMDGGAVVATDGALQCALEQVSREGTGLGSVDIQWTKEHVLSALEAY
ncbi:hypothetical protein EV174_006033, partial [Coemansia sp. RSA 2320]